MMIDGLLLKKMITHGANALEAQKALVDSLNVFPVPDGDTGTNMSLTILAAAKEIGKTDTDKAHEVAKAAASGSLRGARGNSGVIMSQLFRGFAKSLEGKDSVNCEDIAAAFLKASETAYKAVMKPKEGTILTVARYMAEKALEMSKPAVSFEKFAEGILNAGEEILKKTTQMLPQLKEAGVVDAGGKGLLIFLYGAVKGAYLKGDVSLAAGAPSSEREMTVDFSAINTDDIRFAYCTEFFINLPSGNDLAKSEAELKAALENMGDSIVVAGDAEIIKVHIHTNHPGNVLETALSHGFLSNLKIENMKLQHTSLLEASLQTAGIPAKETAIVAVAMGAGMSELFIELGADKVIEGGQTMNPSADDFLDAISKVNSPNVILLPNNKNVILAARQAANLCEGRNVYTVPSRSVPEGLAAMMNYLSVTPVGEMTSNMTQALDTVKSGQITLAVRPAVINGKNINTGDVLCMLGDEIELTAKSVEEGALALLKKMTEDGSETVSIHYGKDVTERDALDLKDKFLKQSPDADISVHNSGQPLYRYIFSAE